MVKLKLTKSEAYEISRQRLRMLRKTSAISVAQLAQLISVSPKFIYDLESGRKSIGLFTAIRLASLFSVSLDWLCGKDDCTEVIIESDSEKNLHQKCVQTGTNLQAN